MNIFQSIVSNFQKERKYTLKIFYFLLKYKNACFFCKTMIYFNKYIFYVSFLLIKYIKKSRKIHRKEEFDMLAEKNPYIKSAYDQLQIISQHKQKRLEYEAREKAIRDYNQLMYEAHERGMQQGLQQGLQNLIQKKINKNKTLEQIADDLEKSVEEIAPLYYQIKETMLAE